MVKKKKKKKTTRASIPRALRNPEAAEIGRHWNQTTLPLRWVLWAKTLSLCFSLSLSLHQRSNLCDGFYEQRCSLHLAFSLFLSLSFSQWRSLCCVYKLDSINLTVNLAPKSTLSAPNGNIFAQSLSNLCELNLAPKARNCPNGNIFAPFLSVSLPLRARFALLLETVFGVGLVNMFHFGLVFFFLFSFPSTLVGASIKTTRQKMTSA